jgi:hypothetical protein
MRIEPVPAPATGRVGPVGPVGPEEAGTQLTVPAPFVANTLVEAPSTSGRLYALLPM